MLHHISQSLQSSFCKLRFRLCSFTSTKADGPFPKFACTPTLKCSECLHPTRYSLSWQAQRNHMSAFHRQLCCTGNPQPHHLHATLKFYPSQTGRLIVIGDVHGCAVELAELLVKIKYTQGRDQLVFVGDLVNKGPHSPQVQLFKWPAC